MRNKREVLLVLAVFLAILWLFLVIFKAFFDQISVRRSVHLLVPLLVSSKRLSPDPILSNRARAELNLSWWDSVRCTFT